MALDLGIIHWANVSSSYSISILPKKNVHILGDYNIDLLRESSKDKELFEDFFLQHGYVPTI